ncbi:MAG: hypothetical protein NTV97_18575 [Alphaproteobacteria bacterium]|nr:hypothetical protein [Alphaproteobacteria bacterium]
MADLSLRSIFTNIMVLLVAGLVAALLCSKVFAATLPADEPLRAPTPIAASATATKIDDAAAAAALRAFIAGQRPTAAVMVSGQLAGR